MSAPKLPRSVRQAHADALGVKVRDLRNSAVLWRGPSPVDGAPIMLVVSGLANESSNPKTGDMLQTWIVRSDVPPHEALKSGADGSVCGSCPLRGAVCYVSTFQAPLSVWRAVERGRAHDMTGMSLRGFFAGRRMRLGAYGDPAMIPRAVWDAMLVGVATWTGYTHQFRAPWGRGMSDLVMASAETERQAEALRRQGWRTFRVSSEDVKTTSAEVVCPATPEGGGRATCASCGLCKGTSSRAKSVVLLAHGNGASKLRQAVSA